MAMHAVNVLINSGCTKSIMDLDWARERGFNFKRMHKPMVFKNVDGTENVARVFCYSINIHLFLAGHVENIQFILEKIYGHKIILRHDWLGLHNPKINWDRK